jgi:hypothetical protein
MCNAYNLRHRNEAILDIARAMQLAVPGLPPLKWSTPHVGFGRVGGPFDGTQEEA